MTTTETSILLLNSSEINQKIKRMAYEILEANYSEKQIILAGICEQGELIAKQLAKHLVEISSIDITVTRIDLDKSHPFRQASDTISGEVKSP